MLKMSNLKLLFFFHRGGNPSWSYFYPRAIWHHLFHGLSKSRNPSELYS